MTFNPPPIAQAGGATVTLPRLDTIPEPAQHGRDARPPRRLARAEYGAFFARWASATKPNTGGHARNEAFPSEGGVLPESIPNIGFSDHWSFWQEGYPALMVTDTASFRYPYYHTPEDTVDKIDFERLARVVRGLKAVVVALVRVDRKKS